MFLERFYQGQNTPLHLTINYLLDLSKNNFGKISSTQYAGVILHVLNDQRQYRNMSRMHIARDFAFFHVQKYCTCEDLKSAITSVPQKMEIFGDLDLVLQEKLLRKNDPAVGWQAIKSHYDRTTTLAAIFIWKVWNPLSCILLYRGDYWTLNKAGWTLAIIWSQNSGNVNFSNWIMITKFSDQCTS